MELKKFIKSKSTNNRLSPQSKIKLKTKTIDKKISEKLIR